MPCFHPITMYRSKSGRNPDTGAWPLVFNRQEGYKDLPVKIPCGQCIGCRLNYSKFWAVRCMHEYFTSDNGYFFTLTFDDEHLAPDLSLHKDDFVNFMKRLRKKFGNGIRFFHCGEYGEQSARPHHHAIIYNVPLSDLRIISYSHGQPYYISDTISRLWPFGYHIIGNVTFDSCAYVARYVVKKVTGVRAAEHYRGRIPEYVTMSRRPGIGREFYEKYHKDMYAIDKVVLSPDKMVNIPRYYDKIHEQCHTSEMEKIRDERLKNFYKRYDLQRFITSNLDDYKLCEVTSARKDNRLC